MVFTPEQYRHIAKTYDSVAADYTMSPAQREAYARKADWYRTLARLGDKPKWATPDNKIPELMSGPAAEKRHEPIPSLLAAALRSLLPWQRRR